MLDAKAGSLSQSWQGIIGDQFDQKYMKSLRAFLASEKQAGKTIFPDGKNIFKALNHTPFEQVKVVILGQDPYHGQGQAHGFCFSVPSGVALPPSLVNINKELVSDLGINAPVQGNLCSWVDQGVLLLNSVLTVEQAKAGSHQGKGWEVFTDRIIQVLNEYREHIVFLLWGSYAQKKGQFIDNSRHFVLHAPHPSPLSAYRGFFGCRHFSQTNAYLTKQGLAPIDWARP